MHYESTSEGLLKPIKEYLDDPLVSEILLNKPQEIYVEKKGVFSLKKIPEYTERLLQDLFLLIANENQQRLNERTPLLSGSLRDGTRVQLVMPPAARYPAFSMRRQVMRSLTLEDYPYHTFYGDTKPFSLNSNSFQDLSNDDQILIHLYQKRDWPLFIRQAVQFKKNIVISGETGSGKTTFLNACLRSIPDHERIITLEDTREIETHHLNQVNLLAPKGGQGAANLTMQTLVQCCLRLRPDRIIMGEIRGAELLDFISASCTGHRGSITSIHADNPRVAFMRMTQMYKLNNVPSMRDQDILRELKEVVDIIIQVSKTEQGRRLQSIYYKNAAFAEDEAY